MNLSGGDSTGSWQLNYPVPYEGEKVMTHFNRFTRALQNAVANRMSKNFKQYFQIYQQEIFYRKIFLNYGKQM